MIRQNVEREVSNSVKEPAKGELNLARKALRVWPKNALRGLLAVTLPLTMSPLLDSGPARAQTALDDSEQTTSAGETIFAAGPDDSPIESAEGMASSIETNLDLVAFVPERMPGQIATLDSFPSFTTPSGLNSATRTNEGLALFVKGGNIEGPNAAATISPTAKAVKIPGGAVLSAEFSFPQNPQRSRFALALSDETNPANNLRAVFQPDGMVALLKWTAGIPTPENLGEVTGFPLNPDKNIATLVRAEGSNLAQVYVNGQKVIEAENDWLKGVPKNPGISLVRTGQFNPDDRTEVTAQVSRFGIWAVNNEPPPTYAKPAVTLQPPTSTETPNPSGLGLVWQRPKEEVGDGPWMGNTRMCLEGDFDRELVECRTTRLQVPLNERVNFVFDNANVQTGERFTTQIHGIKSDGSLVLFEPSVYRAIINNLGRRLRRTDVNYRFVVPGTWSMQSQMGNSATDFRFRSR